MMKVNSVPSYKKLCLKSVFSTFPIMFSILILLTPYSVLTYPSLSGQTTILHCYNVLVIKPTFIGLITKFPNQITSELQTVNSNSSQGNSLQFSISIRSATNQNYLHPALHSLCFNQIGL